MCSPQTRANFPGGSLTVLLTAFKHLVGCQTNRATKLVLVLALETRIATELFAEAGSTGLVAG